MSGTGETTTDFAGEARDFRIRLGEIRRIQSKCGDVSIGEIARRLSKAVQLLRLVGPNVSLVEALGAGVEIFADDVREVIFQGLVGHDMPAHEATKLVRAEIDDRGLPGLLDNVGVAFFVLCGSQKTPEAEEPPGETSAGKSPATAKRRSISRSSTASARRSASPRATSTG